MGNREVGDFFADEVMRDYIYDFRQILSKENDLICLKLLIIRIENYIKSESNTPDNHLFGLKLFRLLIKLLAERCLEIIRKSGDQKPKGDDLEKQTKVKECYDETNLNDEKLLYFIKLFEEYREKNNDEITREFVDRYYEDLNQTLLSISDIADDVIIDNYILMLKEKLTRELSPNDHISISNVLRIITNFIKTRPELFERAKAKQKELLEQLESEKQETQEKNNEIKKNGYDLDDYKNAIDEYINMEPSEFLKEVDKVMQKLKQYTITRFREEIKDVKDGYYLKKIKYWLTGVNSESPAKTDLFRLDLPYNDLIDIIDTQLNLPNITEKNESIDYQKEFTQSKYNSILNTFRRHAKTPYFIITTVIKNKINPIENFENIARLNINDDNKVKECINYLIEKLSQQSKNDFNDTVIREMIVAIMQSVKEKKSEDFIKTLPQDAQNLAVEAEAEKARAAEARAAEARAAEARAAEARAAEARAAEARAAEERAAEERAAEERAAEERAAEERAAKSEAEPTSKTKNAPKILNFIKGLFGSSSSNAKTTQKPSQSAPNKQIVSQAAFKMYAAKQNPLNPGGSR
jgi:hypothetical protein